MCFKGFLNCVQCKFFPFKFSFKFKKFFSQFSKNGEFDFFNTATFTQSIHSLILYLPWFSPSLPYIQTVCWSLVTMAIEQLREHRCSWLTASEGSAPSELASGDEVELCCSGEQGVVGTESTRLPSPPAFVSSMVGRCQTYSAQIFSTSLGPTCPSSL